MQRRSAVAVVEAGLTGAAVLVLAVLALAVLAAVAIPASPARAGSSGLVVKVTPTRGLVDRQTVTLTGRGLTAGGGNASGRYTLILRKRPSGWKIIHLHASEVAAQAK